MNIYTKTGDQGDTSLFGGQRVAKSSIRIHAYGTVDELNTHLGIVRTLKPEAEIDRILERLQHQLFILGADLAAPADQLSGKVHRIQQHHIQGLEQSIDMLDARLEPLRSFILPGGSIVGAQLHVARAICRRAERLTDELGRKENIGKLPLVYLNRLADLLFVLARAVNKNMEIQETLWNGDKE